MKLEDDHIILRSPEPRDVEQLYLYRNDREIKQFLGGFSTGYSVQDLLEWVDYHRRQVNEILWIIADGEADICLGHVGFYNIDHRIRKAEFAILIGDKNRQGKGLGQLVTRMVIDFGFDELNFHRIELDVLATNPRAIHIYEKLGFKQEGIQREADFRGGRYIDVINMAILEHERTWR